MAEPPFGDDGALSWCLSHHDSLRTAPSDIVQILKASETSPRLQFTSADICHVQELPESIAIAALAKFLELQRANATVFSCAFCSGFAEYDAANQTSAAHGPYTMLRRIAEHYLAHVVDLGSTGESLLHDTPADRAALVVERLRTNGADAGQMLMATKAAYDLAKLASNDAHDEAIRTQKESEDALSSIDAAEEADKAARRQKYSQATRRAGESAKRAMDRADREHEMGVECLKQMVMVHGNGDSSVTEFREATTKRKGELDRIAAAGKRLVEVDARRFKFSIAPSVSCKCGAALPGAVY